MEVKIFNSISDAEKFFLQKIVEGYKTSLTVAKNYVSVNFAKQEKMLDIAKEGC